MAFYKYEGMEEPTEPECPVCYESLSGSERTLSCGHVFCHDCLVRTLVSITGDGVIRDTIICPVCRHLTFIKKQTDAEKEESKQGDQTLRVPIPGAPGAGSSAVRRENCPAGLRLEALFTAIDSLLVFPNRHNASLVFIVSEQVRPMAEEDALRGVSTVVAHVQRKCVKICTTGRWLYFLLSIFTIGLLALVCTGKVALGATLPWILMA